MPCLEASSQGQEAPLSQLHQGRAQSPLPVSGLARIPQVAGCGSELINEKGWVLSVSHASTSAHACSICAMGHACGQGICRALPAPQRVPARESSASLSKPAKASLPCSTGPRYSYEPAMPKYLLFPTPCLGRTCRYYKRYQICQEHCRQASVTVDGVEQRFCQQCGRFHCLGEFHWVM